MCYYGSDVNIARPFNTVDPVHHCQNGYLINGTLMITNTNSPFYTVALQINVYWVLWTILSPLSIHLRYKREAGVLSWNQNKLNGQVKILTCIDSLVGYLKIVYWIMTPISFDLSFQAYEWKLPYENYAEDIYPLKTITAHILNICNILKII